MRLMAVILRMIAAQLATEMASRMAITIWTTKLACNTSETIDMSWFISGIPEWQREYGRV